jgi:uncharacterized protein YgbK (DUF1537 family)
VPGRAREAEVIIGVLADDVTGANDIGIMFAKWGLQTHVYPYLGQESEAYLPEQGALPQVCILDTNSRLDTPQDAYCKVFSGTRWLYQSGFRQFFNKTCSVFRGNIGAEFDAMLDALDLDFALVVLGFPKNGRLTLDGIHFVHSKPLAESEFRYDPIHPMRSSSLVDILRVQTQRRVSALDQRVIAQGVAHLRKRIHEKKTQCNYLILDVAGQESLQTIAEAAGDELVFCGSSALAEELPAAWGIAKGNQETLDLPGPSKTGILCTVGSLMPQTAAQIEHMREQGVPAFVLNTQSLFSERERLDELQQLVSQVSAALADGQDVILQSPRQPQTISEAQEPGNENVYSAAGLGRLISTALAEITAGTLELTGQNRLIVAGGETSAAVCKRLGIYGQRIWKEIQPGLPSCVSLTGKPLLLVLKSGSFGSPDFFEQALSHLRSQ